MIFTREEYQNIAEYIKALGVRDTDMPLLDQIQHPLTGEETFVIVKDQKNVRIPLNVFLGKISELEDAIVEIRSLIGQYHPGIFNFNVSVSPKTIQKGTPTNVTVDVTNPDNVNMDKVTLKVGGITRIYNNINNVHDISTISDTEDIIITVIQNGIVYTRTIKVVAYTPSPTIENKYMYIGGGQSYQDVCTDDNKKDITNGIQGTYNVSIPQTGGYFYLIIPSNVTFNALNMLFDFVPDYEDTVTLEDGNTYKVYKEQERWSGGNYEIEIK